MEPITAIALALFIIAGAGVVFSLKARTTRGAYIGMGIYLVAAWSFTGVLTFALIGAPHA